MALLGWVAGAPLLLLRWGGWPPTGAPGWEQFGRLPLPPLADQVVIGTLGVALWGIWGQFAGAVVAEVVTLARRREPRRPDDAIRRFAGHMVRSVTRARSPLAQPAPPAGPGAALEPEPGAQHEPGVAAGPEREPAPGPVTAGAAAIPRRAALPVPAPIAAVRRLDDILGEVEVLVRVLGEVDAVRPGSSPAGADEELLPARQKALEALVYLALSDVGVSRRELERALFPAGPGSERVLYNTIKAVLKVVGDQHPAATTGRHYVLSERVVTDYGIFCDLAAEGQRADDPGLGATLLDDALALVRGEPFSGISRGYSWAAAHRATMVAQVVDVAERLAGMRMAEGDRQAAEEAARRGLRASPGDERLVGLLTQAAGR
jgi:hypothetical protein